MRAPSIFRSVLALTSLSVGLSLAGVCAQAQDIGVDVGGAAGIFRPKNPEAKKRTTRPSPVVRRGSAARTTGATNAAVEDRIEELLDKGNQFRDARRFAEAEAAYQSIL
jgi:hypothetical protein